MGITFPSYYVWSGERALPSRNIYDRPFPVEHQRLQRSLDLPGTTKGHWGQIINIHTAPGYGLRVLKLQLGYARGLALVRTGRAFASISYPEPSYDPHSAPKQLFDVDLAEYGLFLGTMWHMLLPLARQRELGLFSK